MPISSFSQCGGMEQYKLGAISATYVIVDLRPLKFFFFFFFFFFFPRA
jgi:hypothetical protein